MGYGSDSGPADADRDLETAMAMSLADQGVSGGRTEEEDLQLAMQLSKSFMEQESSVPERTQQTEASVMDQSSIVSEEDEIQRAIAMSLEAELKPAAKDQQTKVKPSASTSSQMSPKKNTKTQDDNS